MLWVKKRNIALQVGFLSGIMKKNKYVQPVFVVEAAELECHLLETSADGNIHSYDYKDNAWEDVVW